MKKGFFRFILVVLFICTTLVTKVFSQEDAYTSQIFLNPYLYNPAAAGINNRTEFMLSYRQQWLSVTNAPRVIRFTTTTAIKKKVPFAVNIYNDQRAIFNTSGILITGGYRAMFSDNHYIALAISAGIRSNNTDIDPDYVIDPDDQAIVNALESNMQLDGNAGILYHNQGFTLGASLPQMFTRKALSLETFEVGEVNPLNKITGMIGYDWEVVEDVFSVEPYAIYHHDALNGGQIEGSLTLHLKKIIWLGGGYRQDYGYSGHFGFGIKEHFAFSYSYEYAPLAITNFSNGSHEVMLGIMIGKKKPKRANVVQKRREMLMATGRVQPQQTQQQSLYRIENDPFAEPPTPIKEPVVEPEPEPEPTETFTPAQEEPEPEEQYTEAFEFLTEQAEEKEPEPEPEIVLEEDLAEETADTVEILDLSGYLVEEEQNEESIDELSAISIFETLEEETPEEVTTFNDEGIYIGPTTVRKGEHLLELDKGYYVVVGTFPAYREAEELSDQLFIQGFFTKFGYISQTANYYVYISYSSEITPAERERERLARLGRFKNLWVLTVK